MRHGSLWAATCAGALALAIQSPVLAQTPSADLAKAVAAYERVALPIEDPAAVDAEWTLWDVSPAAIA